MDLVVSLSVLFLLATVFTIRWVQYRLRRARLAFLAGLFTGGKTKLRFGHPTLRFLYPDD